MSVPTLAVVSDLHTGSTIGLCPPGPVPLDDGGEYIPSKAQAWLWKNWLDYWRQVKAARKGWLGVILNGDLVDGDHHGTAQIISRHPGTQFDVLCSSLQPIIDLKPDVVIVVRGTETHVGKSGATEEGAARWLSKQGLNVIGDPTTKTKSWWHFRGEFRGTLIAATHHGRMGRRPWTVHGIASTLGAQIFYEHAATKERHPDIALRSHYHRHIDSHDAAPVRVIQTPAWQLATGYAHKVVPETLADVGGVIIQFPEGPPNVRTVLYQPERSPIQRIL